MSARQIAVVVILAILAALGANWLLGLDRVNEGDALSSADIVVYEDGSGVQYFGDKEIRTFREGTFVWNCRTMGNRRCGHRWL